MRALVLAALLSGCALPRIDAPPPPARAATPALLPLSDVLAGVPDGPRIAPAEAEALRDRARRLAATPPATATTGDLAARASDLRARAEALRSTD